MCKNNFLVETEVYKGFYTLRVGNKNTYLLANAGRLSSSKKIAYTLSSTKFCLQNDCSLKLHT